MESKSISDRRSVKNNRTKDFRSECSFVANSYSLPTAPLEKDFKIDANGARAFVGNFLCGVETGKRFVNVHLHCNVSNLRIISKMSTLPSPPKKFLRTPMATLTLAARFHVWANQAKLTTYETEN